MTTSRDLDLAQSAYRRGLVDWALVVRVGHRLLPTCPRCGGPANGAGWRAGETLCADCASDRMAARDVALGRLPLASEV